MSFRDCLVVERSGGWLVVVGDNMQPLSLDVSIEELVACVELMIKQAGIKTTGCVLAPASTSCFFAMIQVGDEIDVRDRPALMYELEDHLPIDAESMVADFVVVPSASQSESRVASVAVEVDRWRAIADAFELAGIPVRSIVPAAILATRSVCRGANQTDTVQYLFVDQSQCDLVTLQGETLIDWKHSNVHASTLKRHRLLAAAEPDRVVVVGADAAQQAAIAGEYVGAELASESVESHWTGGAELALGSQSKRWFDLRRDQLGPSDPLRPVQTQLRLVTLSAAACLLAVVFGGWWRTQRIEQEIANVRAEASQHFREAFPESKMPAALLRRVRSEHARVMGSRGASSQVDVPQSAPEVLRELLAALPSNVRFRITSIHILDGQVDLDLQVRSPVDAGALATSLSSAGFDVKPPVTTQKDTKTFTSILEAVWSGAATDIDLSENQSARDAVSMRVSKRRETNG